MKRLITFLLGLLAAGYVHAGPLQFTDATIQTTGLVQVVQTPDDDGLTVNGWLDTVIVDITAGTTVTNTVTLSTLEGEGTGAARTLLTISNLTDDGVYPVRDIIVNQAGADVSTTPARIPLFGDKLRLTAQMTNTDTNSAVTMTVYVILSPTP